MNVVIFHWLRCIYFPAVSSPSMLHDVSSGIGLCFLVMFPPPPPTVDVDDSLCLTCEAVAERECVIVKIKMICFSPYRLRRERDRGRDFFHISMPPLSRDPFMVLRVICVLRAFLLLWDLYTFSPCLFQFIIPPSLLFFFACVACPNCLKSVVYYPNKGFCKWIPPRTGGGSIVGEGRTTTAWQWASLSRKSLRNLSCGHFGNTFPHSTHRRPGLWVFLYRRESCHPAFLKCNLDQSECPSRNESEWWSKVDVCVLVEKHLYSCAPLFFSLVSVSVSDDGTVLPRLAQQIIVLLLCKFLSWFSTRSTAEVTDEAHISITYLAKLHSVLPVAFKDFSRMCCCELIHIVNKVAAVLSITQTFLCSESETGFISK